MQLSPVTRRLIERIINTAETGRPEGRYGLIAIFADGPHNIRQITYGRAQTTEYGNLRALVQMYSAANGMYSAALRPYAERVGSVALTDDATFKQLLRDAGNKDVVMARIQDEFFAKHYFKPAMRWADENGFTLPLSALVIYDSFIHSGSILWPIRMMFDESPPASGGDEKVWITHYVNARDRWLKNHPRKILHATTYRTRAYKQQITKDNWDLALTPVDMNGTKVRS
jgi:chitosanase